VSEALKPASKIWRCKCGNKDQDKIVTASDGEIVCARCGTVLDQIILDSMQSHEDAEKWDEEADLCRKILEDRVSKRGWEF